MFTPRIGTGDIKQLSRIIRKQRRSQKDCDADHLYGKAIDICNYLNLLLILPFCTIIFCLPYGTHDVEHCRTLPDNAEYGINHSNNVRLPVASSTSFPAREELIRRRIDDSERLKDSGLMLPYQTVWLSMTVKV